MRVLFMRETKVKPNDLIVPYPSDTADTLTLETRWHHRHSDTTDKLKVGRGAPCASNAVETLYCAGLQFRKVGSCVIPGIYSSIGSDVTQSYIQQLQLELFRYTATQFLEAE